MKNEFTQISYYHLNELATAAKSEVLLHSLYTGAISQINSLEAIVQGRDAKIAILENDIIQSKNELLRSMEDLNTEYTNITTAYRRDLRKAKSKKWFWILPAAALGYLVGNL